MTAIVHLNPFATRFTRPGRIPPLDPSGEEIDLPALVHRLARCGNRAAIRGPHGSGKSTLLVALADRLRDRGLLGGLVRLGDGWRRDLLAVARAIASCDRGRVLCIDGWERLGGWAAAIFSLLANATGRGLLVTAHGDGPMPTLAACSTNPRLLSRIVERLPDRFGLVGEPEILQAFHEAGGDVREALFLLYDRFEQAADRPVRS